MIEREINKKLLKYLTRISSLALDTNGGGGIYCALPHKFIRGHNNKLIKYCPDNDYHKMTEVLDLLLHTVE